MLQVVHFKHVTDMLLLTEALSICDKKTVPWRKTKQM